MCGGPPGGGGGPEIPDPLLQGVSGQGRAGVGGGWKRSGAHLPPRQRPRAGGWRAPRPPRCTRSCGSHSAGACSGLGATVGEGRDRAHVTEGGRCGALRRRTWASLGPGVQAQERTGKSGGRPGSPLGPPHRLRPSWTSLGPKGALLTCMLRQQVRIQTLPDTPGHRPRLPCLSRAP